MAGALALFILPAGTETGERLMDWESLRALPWDVLVLFGGGLSLAAAIDQSGLAAWVGTVLHGLATWPTVLLIAGLVTVTVAMSEFASNTATAAAFLPLAGAIAASAGLDPLVLTIPVVLGASCGFMMPVATPPNTIVFGSGMLTVAQMCRSGLCLNIIGIVLITALGYGVLGFLFRAGAVS
jgi:sodium-dependent dicarboxylate transporter 2/3/5